MSDSEQAKALRKELNAAINALSVKITHTSDELIQADIAQQIGSLMSQRQNLTRKILTKSSAKLNSTLEALQALTTEAKAAKKDIEKIEKMIQNAAKTVDKVTQFIGGLAKAASLGG